MTDQVYKDWCQIRKEQAELNIRLQYLQYHCKHPDVKKVNKSDTGNWSKADDVYWTECKCPDCGKYWTEDQ